MPQLDWLCQKLEPFGLLVKYSRTKNLEKEQTYSKNPSFKKPQADVLFVISTLPQQTRQADS